jgi:hypothetical protein
MWGQHMIVDKQVESKIQYYTYAGLSEKNLK